MINKVTKTEELYLITILKLSKDTGKVKGADIARSLDYARASVLGMLRKLEAKDLVYFDEKKKVHLTEEGSKIATIIFSRQQALTMAFIHLGASQELAEREARRIQNEFSDEMLEKLDNHIRLNFNNFNN